MKQEYFIVPTNCLGLAGGRLTHVRETKTKQIKTFIDWLSIQTVELKSRSPSWSVLIVTTSGRIDGMFTERGRDRDYMTKLYRAILYLVDEARYQNMRNFSKKISDLGLGPVRVK
jgi:hypothetical protein